MRLPLILAFVVCAAPALAQTVEIFIPPKDGEAETPGVTVQPTNRLAACMINPTAAACSGVGLGDGGTQFESATGVPDVVLETLIFDPTDTGNTPVKVAPPPSANAPPPPAPDYAAPPTTYTKPVALPAIAITVEFDFDSDAIRFDQFQKINALIAALNDPALANTQFAVIGHTDASGSDSYNCNLSRRRALSVTAALRGNAVLLPMFPVGFGERVLKNPVNPTAAENRRVVFLRLPNDPAPILQNANAVCAGL